MTHMEKVYDAGGASAFWSIGDASFKVQIMDAVSTLEHVALAYVHSKGPRRLYRPECMEAWLGMDEEMKQHHVLRVADICNELEG